VLIGELAAKAGVTIETIRYYEREGVLPPAMRGANNYRLYSAAQVNRLRFIRRVRDMGLTLAEIRTLLAMVENDDYNCAEIKALGERHLAEVRSRIDELRRLERVFSDLVNRCRGSRNINCGIIDAMWD